MRSTASILSLLAVSACTGAESPRAPEALGGDSRLIPIFIEVQRETGVPAEILATLSYTVTRLTMIRPAPDHHHGAPPAWGLMAIDDVERAAALTGLSTTLVRTDVRANVRAAAALLASGSSAPRSLVEWAAAVDAHGPGLGAEVARHLANGWRGTDDEGRRVILSASIAPPPAAPIERIAQGLGYSGAIWNPATPANYTVASRGAPGTIKNVVIHTTQGSYAGTVSWFKNPAARVSAHYVVRSSDGQITHMVDDKNVAWHASCANPSSIGIEHEGFVADPGKWYTEAMYMASARLTAWLTAQYGIPRDRQHIKGHVEWSSCNNHTDPGNGWNWAHYMDLVTGGGAPKLSASAGASSYPKTMTSGQEATVWLEFVNSGNIAWGVNETRVGTQDPQDRASPFFVNGNWLSNSRATGADHSGYSSGTTGRFSFVIRAPQVKTPTTYREVFQLVQEGSAWFGPKVTLTILVNPVASSAPDASPPPPPPADPSPSRPLAADAGAPAPSPAPAPTPTSPPAPAPQPEPQPEPEPAEIEGGCSYAATPASRGAGLLWLLAAAAFLRGRLRGPSSRRRSPAP